MRVETTAPLRVDLGGGITDIAPLGQTIGTMITNLAIDLYRDSECKLPNHIAVEAENSLDGNTHIFLNEKRLDIGKQDFISKLVKTFLADHVIPLGVIVKVFNTLPKGTGLGGSAVMSLCITAALSMIKNAGQPLDRFVLLKYAHYLERKILGAFGGFQDYIPACFGGYSFIDFPSLKGIDRSSAKIIGRRVPVKIEKFLNASMVLVIRKQQNLSSSLVMDEEIKVVQEGKREAIEALRVLKSCNKHIYEIFNTTERSKKYQQMLGKYMNESWDYQKKLSRLIGKGILQTVEKVAAPLTYGIHGPGSGCNSLLLLVKPGWGDELVKQLERFGNDVDLFYARINNAGLKISVKQHA
jgi:galactokinase/mevalonate kinase-like predicted kinase